jgi:predicted amidohydrolase
MRIALASINQKWENKEENKIVCVRCFEQAKQKQSDLIIFPEMTLTGFSMNTKKTAEKFEDSETIKFFSQHSKKNEIASLFGVCFDEKSGVTNAAVFISKLGIIENVYRKIHPFSFAGENTYFVSGSDTAIVSFEETKFGLSICYDLRFPELYRLYANNCQIMVNIANWPERRIDHWNTLLKARAIEDQFFVIGVNRVGSDNNGLSYVKSSMIFSPDGTKVEPIDYNEDLTFFDLNPEFVQSYRSAFPVLSDIKIKNIVL